MIKITIICLAILLIASLSILLGFNFFIKNKPMKNAEINNDLQHFGIEVVRPDSPEFDVELLKYIGDRNELIPMLELAKPFSLIIRNNSGKDIVGISLNWRFENSEGRVQNIERGILTPEILMGIKVTDPSLVGKTSLLYNKDSHFFSFIHGIEQAIINTRKSVENPGGNFRVSPEDIKEYESELALRKADVIDKDLKYSVDIDGVFFSDGTFIGKNETLIFEQLNGLIQARKDFINKLSENRLKKVKDSDTVDQIISESSKKKEMPNTRAKLNPQEIYQRSYESELLSLFRELKRKKTRMSDNSIINSFISSKNSEYIPLKKLN